MHQRPHFNYELDGLIFEGGFQIDSSVVLRLYPRERRFEPDQMFFSGWSEGLGASVGIISQRLVGNEIKADKGGQVFEESAFFPRSLQCGGDVTGVKFGGVYSTLREVFDPELGKAIRGHASRVLEVDRFEFLRVELGRTTVHSSEIEALHQFWHA